MKDTLKVELLTLGGELYSLRIYDPEGVQILFLRNNLYYIANLLQYLEKGNTLECYHITESGGMKLKRHPVNSQRLYNLIKNLES